MFHYTNIRLKMLLTLSKATDLFIIFLSQERRAIFQNFIIMSQQLKPSSLIDRYTIKYIIIAT